MEDLVLLVDYVIARSLDKGQPLHMCFVDLEKAFDTVPRARMI